MDPDRQLPPGFVWLFAFLAVLGGVGVSFVTAGTSPGLPAAILSSLVGGLALLGAYVTHSTALQAIAPFAPASLGLAIVHVAILDSLAASAAPLTVGAVIAIATFAAAVGGAVLARKLAAIAATITPR